MGNKRIVVVVFADVSALYATYSMMTYLTEVWKMDLTRAAAMINIWRGISYAIAPLFVLLADTIFGNYAMLVISGISYTVGLGFLSMSTPPVITGTCSEYLPECIGSTQEALFYTGLVLISIGIAGHKASLFSFLQDQNTSADQNDPPFSRRTLVFSIILTIVLYFIEPNWSLQFGIPAIFSLIASLLFLTASSSYKKKKRLGNPLKSVFRVDWPFASKIIQQYHDDPENRCEEQNRRKLSRVKEVDEETKLAFGAIPIWIAFIICKLVSCFGDTYFQEQADNMYRQIGKLKISQEIILLVCELAKLVFEKIIKKLESGGAPVPFGMEALLFSLLCCITAAKVETLRLDVIRRNELQDYPGETIPMSVFWLLPQYVLLAGLDTFFDKSVVEYFSRVPSISLQNYARPIGDAVSGLGSIASPLPVVVVGKISEIAGNPNWFQDIINTSRLDNYYWTLATFMLGIGAAE